MPRPQPRSAIRRTTFAPVDLDRMRAAAKARRAVRPVASTRALDAVRRHLEAIARGDASASPAVRRGTGRS
jgi:hypothetical protein